MDAPGIRESDFYVELMRDSRGLSSEHSDVRQRWFEDLDMGDKEEVLFELEMLLKGLVCFSDPSNHPGPRRQEPTVSREYREELRVLGVGCERVAELARHLLAEEEESGLFGRPIRRIQRDHIGGKLIHESVDQETPKDSLRLLGHAFGNLTDVAEALTRLDNVPYGVFASLSQIIGREIQRSVYFNPLLHLEFRPEYDRLAHVELLEVVYGTRPTGAKRAVTLTFLALLRLVRYLESALHIVSDPARSRLLYLPLAAVRSDGRALTRFLGRDARGWLSDGFEQDIMSLRASELSGEVGRLREDYELLHKLAEALHTNGDRLQLELRATFERGFESLESPTANGETLRKTEESVVSLVGFVRGCVVSVGQVFDPEMSGESLFEAFPSTSEQTERLRQDVWMFAQILRGFLAKAEAAPAAVDRWTGSSSYRFVHEFITYYKNFGARLTRATGYDTLDAFEIALESTRAADVIHPDGIEDFVAKSTTLHTFLMQAFEDLGETPELDGVSFDRRSAAETLRLYLDR